MDEVYKTTLINATSSTIYNNYGVKAATTIINNNSSTTVYHIEGGFNFSGTTIYKDSKNYITGITTTGETIVNNDDGKITGKNGVYYYRNKLLCSGNTGYYNGEKVTDEHVLISSNDGETNITAKVSATDGNQLIAISNGISDNVLYISFNGGENGYLWEIQDDADSDSDFNIDSDGNLRYGPYIIGYKDGNIYNRHDLNLSNYKSLSYVDVDGDIYIDINNNEEESEIESEERDNVYYTSHDIEEIKKYIPDLNSFIYKNNDNESLSLDTLVVYNKTIGDKKTFSLIEGGYNNSSYKIKVEPQVITNSMISNNEKLCAYVINNNGDHIPYNTYTTNGYKLTYKTDGGTEQDISGDTCFIQLSTETPIFNEIKFILKNGDKVVNEEIVEVLGENKLIKLTEYVDVTDGSNSYTIQPTKNSYYGTDIKWKNSN